MNKYRKQAKEARVAKIRSIACERKVRYTDATAAWTCARKMDQTAYSCRFCKGWHLTNLVSKTLAVVRSRGKRAIIHP